MFITRKRVVIGIMAVMTVLGLFAGSWAIQQAKGDANYEELKKFSEVLSLIRKNYVDETKVKDLVTGAIKGMVSSLDQHSGFMTPEQFKEFQVETKGEFGGIGIQIGLKDGILTVIAPIEDTPAYRAGIKAGDKILKINTDTTKDMNLLDAVAKMRGPKGTPITLTIFREGWKETREYKIVRDIIKIRSIKARIIMDDIAYIKLTHFQEATASDLAKSLEKLKKEGFTSIILDLRNDPGGLLNVSVDVAGQFLPPKTLVVYIKNKNGQKTEYFTDNEFPSFTDIPMVVLVNHGSASASEIVAGALKDWKRAVIIGVQTFGKGSVQSLIPLSDGSGLRLTTAKYYTPNGTSIQGVGITPDILVKLNQADSRDSVMKKGKSKPQPDQHPEDEQKEDEPPPAEVDDKDDIQLQRAIDTLKTWKVIESMTKKAA